MGKKFIVSLIMVFSFIFILTGCTKTKSITYKVETGDNIKVSLKVNDGYDLKQAIDSNATFEITKAGDVLSQAIFTNHDYYNQYVNSVSSDDSAKIIEQQKKKNLEYIFYSYSHDSFTEYNYIIKIVDTNTAILIGNIKSEDSAKEVFNRLSFEKK